MKENTIVTVDPFYKNRKLNRINRYVIGGDKRIIGGISKNVIYDEQGHVLANRLFGKRSKAVYATSDGRRYTQRKGQLFFEGVYVGHVVGRPKKSKAPWILATCCVILAALIGVLNTLLREKVIPSIHITSNGLAWGAEEELDVFPNGLMPGTEGSYSFEVHNRNDITLQYTLYIEDDFAKAAVPMTYRLKMNGMYVVGDKDTWVTCEELRLDGACFAADSIQVFTLEWCWQFEGNDNADTLAGDSNGGYGIIVTVEAEVNKNGEG